MGDIVELIDNAIRDNWVSGDAMRWAPAAQEVDPVVGCIVSLPGRETRYFTTVDLAGQLTELFHAAGMPQSLHFEWSAE